jgi:hypothetical protein
MEQFENNFGIAAYVARVHFPFFFFSFFFFCIYFSVLVIIGMQCVIQFMLAQKVVL